jgi:5-methyltetrahydrofolate--homocysteine methyltransferase
VLELHRSYLKAGADIVETDTFGATPVVLAEYDLAKRCKEINRKAAEIARKACGEFEGKGKKHTRFVAGSIGPTTRSSRLPEESPSPSLRNRTRSQVEGSPRAAPTCC